MIRDDDQNHREQADGPVQEAVDVASALAWRDGRPDLAQNVADAAQATSAPTSVDDRAGAPEEAADPVLTDDEVEQCVDAMKRVYLVRPSNARAARLLREAMKQVLAARREHLPADQLRDGRVLALFGESRAGKSALIQRLLARTTALHDPGDGRTKPLVDIQVKGPATLRSVGFQILEGVGYEPEANLDEGRVWRRVYAQLRLCGVVTLHLGEFANVSGTANAIEKVKLRNTIKSLVINELHPIVVILSGLPEIVPFLTGDTQIGDRAAFVGLEALQPEDSSTIAEGVRRIAGAVGMAVDEDELEAELVPRLLHAARHQLGRAMEYAVAAAARALAPEDDDGDRLPPERVLRLRHFAGYYEDVTGNASWANPFRAREWDMVDANAAGLVFPSQLADVEATVQTPARGANVKGKTR